MKFCILGGTSAGALLPNQQLGLGGRGEEQKLLVRHKLSFIYLHVLVLI